LVLLDFHLGDSDGASTAEALLKLNPTLYILIHSGDGSRVAVKNSWQAGAVGFIEKGEEPESFLQQINNWCRKYEETALTVSLQTSLDEKSEAIASLGMVGRSEALSQIARRVKKYRSLSDNVLILGETGTGKEKIARALNRGPESQFFAVNCASYSGNSELMEADLFGYVKGAFTGANKDHTGVFESANGGTVFLDEIQALDLNAQHKLLRAIQEKSVRPDTV
jgi:DNA-binding NtrC family response regulator